MTGITRSKAAKTIAAYFGKESTHYGGTYDTYQAGDSKGRTWKAVSDSSIYAEKKDGSYASNLYKPEVGKAGDTSYNRRKCSPLRLH
ncbi:amidoligase family protein [Anaerovibrio sp.]|uniref:amidoligase family protein n=1 Tax=Anaerovibrio sp. TaxID=1872532 RepID=UPI00388D3EF8